MEYRFSKNLITITIKEEHKEVLLSIALKQNKTLLQVIEEIISIHLEKLKNG